MGLRIKLVATPGNISQDIKSLLDKMDRDLFPDSPLCNKNDSWWWICYDGDIPVAFAGLTPYPMNKTMFLSRCGVIKPYRGNGLQRKLIKKREKIAREEGYRRIITYTSDDNVISANNLIKMGYLLYTPKWLWGVKGAFYLIKHIC